MLDSQELNYENHRIKSLWDNNADYYNNPDNEGHIYFQLINLSPYPILIKKGDCFGQGIILPYYTCTNEIGVTTTRKGGFGSTSNDK